MNPAEPVRLATFDQHRSLLFSIAYRMLGTVSDAEDMLQETFIRWQGSSEQDIRNPRAFLVTIITRLCLKHLQSSRVKRELYVGQWLPEPLLTEDANDPLGVLRVDESLSMALLVLLERLTPPERAVFILREVFEFAYADIAGALGQTEENCRQLLHRAREHVGTMRRRFDTSKQQHRMLVETFIKATRSGDMEALLALLSRDVTLHSDGGGIARALPNTVEGSTNVARALVLGMAHYVPRDVVFRPAFLNGDPGIISYLNDRPYSAVVLDVRNDVIQNVFVITNPDKLRHFAAQPRP